MRPISSKRSKINDRKLWNVLPQRRNTCTIHMQGSTCLRHRPKSCETKSTISTRLSRRSMARSRTR
eukprot:5583102-Pyramimonas_sp.AAC.1